MTQCTADRRHWRVDPLGAVQYIHHVAEMHSWTPQFKRGLQNMRPKRRTYQFIGMLAAALLCANVLPSRADVLCSETIVHVIVHTDGIVYFSTNGACAVNWCSLQLSTPAANSAAYALLLSAQAQGIPVLLYWFNLTSCSQQNPVYTSPAYVST
jgi:hypothetical protein